MSSERNNYLLAVTISLLFHLLLCLVTLAPGFWFNNYPGMETVAAEMVELTSQGSQPAKTAEISAPVVKVEAKETKTAVPKKSNPQPVAERKINLESKKQPVKEEPKPETLKQVVAPTQPVSPPKRESAESNDSVSQKPVTAAADGATKETPDNSGNNGSGNAPPAGRSLGDGSGMVLQMDQKFNYPKNPQNEGKEGEVYLKLLIRADGSLESAAVTKKSGDPRLDRAAENYVKQWKFKANDSSYLIELVFKFNLKTGVTHAFINSITRP